MYADSVEHLLSSFSSELSEDVVLDFLDRLVWMTDDNGDELFAARERWLTGDDLRLTKLALGKWCTPVGRSSKAAKELITRAVAKWPELQGRGEERLYEWDSLEAPD